MVKVGKHSNRKSAMVSRCDDCRGLMIVTKRADVLRPSSIHDYQSMTAGPDHLMDRYTHELKYVHRSHDKCIHFYGVDTEMYGDGHDGPIDEPCHVKCPVHTYMWPPTHWKKKTVERRERD